MGLLIPRSRVQSPPRAIFCFFSLLHSETENGDLYYFNFKTGESSWEHPSDKFYKELLDREREKKRKQVSMLKGGSKKGLVRLMSFKIIDI